MNQFKILTFMNPIKKRIVGIRAGAIAGFDYDGVNKCNVIYTPGGVFPVEESLEEIKTKIEQLNGPVGQENKTDVTTTATV
jgi:hypothetical protein